MRAIIYTDGQSEPKIIPANEPVKINRALQGETLPCRVPIGGEVLIDGYWYTVQAITIVDGDCQAIIVHEPRSQRRAAVYNGSVLYCTVFQQVVPSSGKWLEPDIFLRGTDNSLPDTRAMIAALDLACTIANTWN